MVEEKRERNEENAKNNEQKGQAQEAGKEEKQEHQAEQSNKEEKLVKESEYLELKDRLLRLAAEFDNYKKRAARDIENSKLIGKAELMKKLLPTLDEFELALSVSKDSKDIKGFEMIFSNFIEALKSEGLSEIETNGKYDPYKHEIILTKESKEKDGTILEVVRKGYMLNGILLRPATVIVARHKEEAQSASK
ncbi:MAG: nucleotide exchange factor GrpE [Candidatus Micrarchaeia archaeon]|jgi:molecular chaperone GrpE